MTFSGMTGFARADGVVDGLRWAWEARSVNGRGLDVKARLPGGFDALEAHARERCGARFSRGSIQLNLSVKREAAATGARLDMAFLESLMAQAQPFVAQGLASPPRWDGLLQLRGAFVSPDSADETASATALAAITVGLDEALDALATARLQEGRALLTFLQGQVDTLEQLIGQAEAAAAGAPEALHDRIRRRIEQLLADVPLDPQRLAQEAAILAAKADVREELDRLNAHLGEAKSLLAGLGPAGRKLDFLVQELNREVNTLCAKASEMALTQIGLAMKAVIDQLREQASNVE
jgi:uncharacterized protein (TIGR00255 family)